MTSISMCRSLNCHGLVGMSGTTMDPVAGLILCSPGLRPVDLSIINGRIVVKDGQITTIDLQVSSSTQVLFQP